MRLRIARSLANAILLVAACFCSPFCADAQYPAPPVSVRDNGGATAKDGYWAFEPDPAADPSGQKRHGRLIASLPPRSLGSLTLAGLPILADWTSQVIDATTLFYVRDDTGNLDPNNIHRPRILYQNYPLDLTLENTPPTLFADSTNFLLTNPYAYGGQFYAADLSSTNGSYATGLVTSVPLASTQGLVVNAASQVDWSGAYGPSDYNATPMRVILRYFPDGTQITHLDEGEVALYQSCNYQGKAIVFVANTPDFSKLTSPDITLDKTAASIKLGNNTAVTLYSGAGYTGTTQIIRNDVPCLDSTPIARQTTAIQVAPLVDIALASKSCENCRLSGVNLTKYDLSEIDFTGAQLSGATLSEATFNRTILTNAVLDGATGFKGLDLSRNVVATGASFKGTDLSGAILNGAQLEKAVLTGATLTGIKIENTNLQGATLDGALGLESADLSQAQLQGATFKGTNLTQATLPASFDNVNLSGANLTGINFRNISVQHAIFDGATGLAGSDLSLVSFSNTSMRNINLAGAKFYGAFLNGTDLEGSNLSGAFFTNNPKENIPNAATLAGAHLKNVNLSNAQLSGAIFTNTSFYGTIPLSQNTCSINSDGFTKDCATASGATLNGAAFGSAYLYGVDFTNATIVGVQFGNAVLIGANFAKATITSGGLGSETGFGSAFLQGANLATATLTGTSLQNAFVDFRAGGNSVFMELNGNLTGFPNWPTPGQKACVFAYYSAPTTVPTANTTITCPDGTPAGIKGCGRTAAANHRWASLIDISQTDPPTSYLNDATYTNKAAPICANVVPW